MFEQFKLHRQMLVRDTYEPFDQIKCGTLTPKDLRQPCYPWPQCPMNFANKINPF